MRSFSSCARLLAAAAALAVSAPAPTAAASGSVRGSVEGPGIHPDGGVAVRLLSADAAPVTAACAPDGSFSVDAVPAGTYHVAVQTPAGAFAAPVPVSIPPGGSRVLRLELRPAAPLAPAATAWHNPWYSGMIVIGAAIVVGLAAEALAGDAEETPASPD